MNLEDTILFAVRLYSASSKRMKRTSRKEPSGETISERNKAGIVLLAIIFLVATVATMYMGSMPENYMLSVGDTSPYDIVAPRSIADSTLTEQRALEAKAQVPDRMVTSDQINEQVLADVKQFIAIFEEKREQLYVPIEIQSTLTPFSEQDSAVTPTIETDERELQATRTPDDEEMQSSLSGVLSKSIQILGIASHRMMPGRYCPLVFRVFSE